MIEINNISGKRLKKEYFSTVAKKVLSGENRQTDTFSLAFVKKEEIKELNKKFRRKNKATDVLSFNLDLPGEGNKKGAYLGEIVICPDIVSENAKKYKVAGNKEMLKVFVHGILHLCGYDHEKSKKEALIMQERESRYIA